MLSDVASLSWFMKLILGHSTEDFARTQGQNIRTVEAQFCTGEGCQISGHTDSASDSEPVAYRRGWLPFRKMWLAVHESLR